MTDEQNPTHNDQQDYQGTGSASEGGTIYHAEIDPKYKDMVIQNLWAVLKGNGVESDEIEIPKFDGETLEFLAVTILKLKTKTNDRRQAGKVTGPVVLGSAQMVRDAITKEEYKITHSQDVIKRIKDVILSREDKGFGLENEFIKMPFLHKDFVVYEPCQACRGQGRITCHHCKGQGVIACPSCHGSRTEVCPVCNGQQYINGPNNQRQICTHCNGQGKVGCRTCNQTGTVQCPTCKGAGTITCTQCNGHAIISHVFMTEIDCFADFEYDIEKLPERTYKTIKSLGKTLPDHVEFRPVIMGREHEQEHIALPYQIRAPQAEIIFKIKDMDVGAFMFGTNAMLLNMPYILEKLMNTGIESLKHAGMGKGDIAQNLQNAGQYKTLRQLILASSKLGPKKAFKAIMNKTPFGLSEDMCKKLILSADKAMKKITHRPRQIGVLLGTINTIIISSLYFHTARSPLLFSAPKLQFIDMLFDFIVMTLSVAFSIWIVQFNAANTLNKTLSSLMKNKSKSIKTAKAGSHGYWASAFATIAFLCSALSTVYTQNAIPNWIVFFMTML